MMMQSRPVMIMAGGTGGHVYPALAVADELRKQGVPVVWMGTRAGIEARVVPAAGYPVEWIRVGGVRGKGWKTRLMAPFVILSACWQALRVMRRVRPGSVLGMGGFVSGPGGLIAWLLRIPLLIHEQNAMPGLTNRLLSRIASRVLEAFPDSFGSEALHVGNPVRESIRNIPDPKLRLRDHDDALRVLVIGGSLGAARLNEIVPQALSMIDQSARPQVRHQTGRKNLEECQRHYADSDVDADIVPFIDDVEQAYAWADIVICRAGAMTVFELAASGVGSILVPYPYAVDDHQTLNARYLEQAGAAITRQQEELTASWLSETLSEFGQHRDRLMNMAMKARELSMPTAANDVANECLAAGGMA